MSAARLSYAFLFALLLLCRPAHALERIVSIGGSITEILFELGLQEKIVAIDTTSQYPPATGSMKNVGYLRALSAEPIIALNPDLIIYQAGAGPPETIEQLQAAGMQLAKISHKHSLQGVLEKIEQVSLAVNMVPKGSQLISAVEGQLASLKQINRQTRPGVMFILNLDEASALVAGRQTGADSIISLAGGQNVVDHFNSYKPLGAEAIIKLAPEYILTTHRVVASVGSEQDVLNLAALRLTPAAKNNKLIVMDSLLLIGFGPRIGQAVSHLANAIH